MQPSLLGGDEVPRLAILRAKLCQPTLDVLLASGTDDPGRAQQPGGHPLRDPPFAVPPALHQHPVDATLRLEAALAVLPNGGAVPREFDLPVPPSVVDRLGNRRYGVGIRAVAVRPVALQERQVVFGWRGLSHGETPPAGRLIPQARRHIGTFHVWSWEARWRCKMPTPRDLPAVLTA